MAKILVVDDHPELGQLVEKILVAKGHEVILGNNGKEGVQKAQETLPDLIVSDVMMPELDGFGLFEAVRGDPKTATIPVVFLTSLSDPETLLRALRAGVDDFISKPFQREELLDVVETRLENRHSREAGDPWKVKKKGAADDASSTETEALPEAPEPDLPDAAAAAATPAPSPAVVISGSNEPIRFSFSDTKLPDLPAEDSRRESRATLLVCEVRNFDPFRKVLGGVEVVEVLTQFYLTVRKTVQEQQGHVVKFLGCRFVAIFEDADAGSRNQSVRSLKTALLIVLAAQRLKAWLRVRFPERELPELSLTVGVHAGEITVGILPDGSMTVGGKNAELSAHLEAMAVDLGWSICASEPVFAEASEILALGRGAMAPNASGESGSVLVAEVRGPLQSVATNQEQEKNFALLEAAVESNTTVIAALAQEAKEKQAEKEKAEAEAKAEAKAKADLEKGELGAGGARRRR